MWIYAPIYPPLLASPTEDQPFRTTSFANTELAPSERSFKNMSLEKIEPLSSALGFRLISAGMECARLNIASMFFGR